MKKVFLAVAAMAMLATACTKDDAVSGGNDSLVSFTIDSPELQTRYGEGDEAKVLNYAFYNEDGILEAISAITAEKAVTLNADRKATIQVPLVEGRTYSAIFWASAPDAIADGVYTVNWTAKTVEMATNLTANDESYDAFYNYTINIDPAKKTHKIELRRPFAQINIATADKTAASSAGFDAAATKVTVNAYNKLQFAVKEIEGVNTPVAEVAGDMVPFTYGWAANATGTATVGSKTYDMLSMNYVLVDARTLVNVKMEVSEDATNFTAPITRDYTTVPVQRNYRTFIVGNLLTTTNEFNVTTVPGFNPNDEVYYVWDGSELTKPAYDDATKTYTVTKASDLAWIGALVNGTLPSTMRSTEYAAAESIDGCTIVLGDDLDFGGNEFTPIKSATNITFEGNGKAIRNISYANGESYSTMFEIASGTFKNFTMENVKAAAVDNGRAAALLGYYMSGTVEKVHVKNVEIKGFQKLAGLVSNVVASDGSGITIKDCSVENIKISSSDLGATWQAGGLAGFIVTGVSENSTTEVVFENCEVKGQIEINDTPAINEYNDTYYSFYSGGFVGSISASKKVAPVHFNNCKVGTVTATPALSVSPAGTELWGSCSANIEGRPNNVIYVDGVQYVYKTASQKAFEAAIAEGGEVELTEDVEIVAPVVIAEGADVTIDLNGKTISGNVAKSVGHVLQNEGTLTIKGGEISSNAENGGSAIMNKGTLTIEGATLNGAPNANGSWPSYTVNNIGTMTVTNTTITSHHGAVASYGENAVVTLNNSIIDMAGIPGFTSHGIYTYNGGKVVVNGGTYENKATDQNASGASVINGNVEVNAGTFSGRIENYYGTPVLKGGSYSVKPNANFVAAGYKAVEKDGKYVVVLEEVDAVVSTAEEFTNALSEGGNVFLQENINITKLDLTNLTNDVVIDANGKTITTESNYGVQVTAGKNITLKNAKVEMTVEGNYITYAAGFKIENGDYQGNTISLENCEIRMCNTDWAYAVNLPASVKNLNLVIDGCTLEGAIALQCWGDNNTITITNSNLICNYTTSSLYSSYCVALQGDGTNNSENNTLNISGCAFSYSGVDNYNSTIWAVGNHKHNGANTITVDNCTYGEKVEAY